jgi:hypothetical protein
MLFKEIFYNSLLIKGVTVEIFKNPDSRDIKKFIVKSFATNISFEFIAKGILNIDTDNLYLWSGIADHLDIVSFLKEKEDSDICFTIEGEYKKSGLITSTITNNSINDFTHKEILQFLHNSKSLNDLTSLVFESAGLL